MSGKTTHYTQMELAIKEPMQQFEHASIDMVLGYDEHTSNVVASYMSDLKEFQQNINADITINEPNRKIMWANKAKEVNGFAQTTLMNRAKKVIQTKLEAEHQLMSNTQELTPMQLNIVGNIASKDHKFFQEFATSTKESAQMVAVLAKSFPLLVAPSVADAQFMLDSMDLEYSSDASKVIQDASKEIDYIEHAMKSVSKNIGAVVDSNVVDHIKQTKVS